MKSNSLRFAAGLCAAAGLLFPQAPSTQFEIPFRHVVIDNKLPQGRDFHGDCKAVGDIDGDGFIDIVFAGNTLAWYAYPNWTRTVIAKAEQEFTTDMQVGDIDSDGDLDIIVPDGARGKIQWFENPRPNGDPRAPAQWNAHLVGMQGAFTHDVAIGDVNGDGRLDVLTRKNDTVLWLQRTPESFERIVIPGAVERGEGSALADINRDGRLDIVQNGYWIETPADPVKGEWVRHDIDPNWPRQVAVTVQDMNADGRPDVLIGPAESAGRLVCYLNPADPAGKWTEVLIDDDVAYLHTFQAADINNDGILEIVAAEMHQSQRKRVLVYYRQKGKWKQQVVATTGSHNLRLADIGGDGDIDIIGANWGGPHHPLEMWENRIAERVNLEQGWRYTLVDSQRAKWGDFDKPAWLKYFGLAFGDVTGDGHKDIVSGRYFYRNPGTPDAPWTRVDFGRNVDAMLMVDADGDGRMEAIATALPDVYWMRPRDRQGSAWDAVRVGSAPATSHVNGQGAALAQIVRGGKPEVLLAAGDGIYMFEIPAKPSSVEWKRTRIAAGTAEEGIGPADFDGDGRIDVAASDKDERRIWWFRNPGNGAADWERTLVGRTEKTADRCAAADLNGDGRPDIVVTEESPYAGASVYWFENPGKPGVEWTRHTLVTQYTTNSLDLYDMDRDGDTDIVICEHRGSRKLAWWENRNRAAAWTEHVIDVGKEGHLGAKVVPDLDGAIAIANIAWDTYQNLHLWRKQALITRGGWGARATHDASGRWEATLENGSMRVRYAWKQLAQEETFIREFTVKPAAENHAGDRIDAAANRTALRSVKILRDDPRVKTVRLEWAGLGRIPGIQEISIARDLAVLKIDYISWPVNIVDIGTPGGAKTGTYAIYGADKWKRGYLSYPQIYFDRDAKDVGYQNITAVDEPGPLDYHGSFIMGVYNPASGHGYGRVVPVASVDIVKLLWHKGFELFPCFRRERKPFTSWLFAVTGGAEEILSLGKRIADGGIKM